jgi:ribosomal protein S18 acetylase RimI-like enzyme
MGGEAAAGVAVRALDLADLALLVATPEGVFDEPVNPGWAAAFLDDPANLLVAAVAQGAVRGMASATILRHPDKPLQLFVNEVGVHPDWQGRGLGRAMMAALLAAARERGCRVAWVVTEADNAPALALNRSAGGEATPDLVMFEWALGDED